LVTPTELFLGNVCGRVDFVVLVIFSFSLSGRGLAVSNVDSFEPFFG
jgi:hypothetical protein